MNGSLIQMQTFLAAGNGTGEGIFWIQILVLLVVAVCWGLYSLAKNKTKKFNNQRQGPFEKAGSHHAKADRKLYKQVGRLKDVVGKYAAKAKGVQVDMPQAAMDDFDNPEIAGQEKPTSKRARRKVRDLHSGMELLELDFMLSVVENTNGDEEKDVVMRKFNFNELIRRDKVDQVGSDVLKIYAINRGNLYGKDIQCGAVKELAKRSRRRVNVTAEGARTGR